MRDNNLEVTVEDYDECVCEYELIGVSVNCIWTTEAGKKRIIDSTTLLGESLFKPTGKQRMTFRNCNKEKNNET